MGGHAHQILSEIEALSCGRALKKLFDLFERFVFLVGFGRCVTLVGTLLLERVANDALREALLLLLELAPMNGLPTHLLKGLVGVFVVEKEAFIKDDFGLLIWVPVLDVVRQLLIRACDFEVNCLNECEALPVHVFCDIGRSGHLLFILGLLAMQHLLKLLALLHLLLFERTLLLLLNCVTNTGVHLFGIFNLI